jgi:hypothetical protein
MNRLPIDIISQIYLFVPNNIYKLINSDWNTEITYTQKQNIYKIEKWYTNMKYKILFKKYLNINTYILYTSLYFSNLQFLTFPEKIVRIFNLNPDILSIFPILQYRNKNQIIQWCKILPLSLKDFIYIEKKRLRFIPIGG